jgi:hypothetical protein
MKCKLLQCHNFNNKRLNCCEKMRVSRILCLCSSMVFCLLRFNLRKEAKMKRRMISRKKNETI